jgi:integrase
MAGTKRKLKNGKYELCVSNGTKLDGKRDRKYKYVEASGDREADKLLAAFVAECDRGDYDQGEKMLLKDYSALWMADYVEKHLRGKTVSRYDDLLERINAVLGHKKLCDLKPPHLLQFYNMLAEDGIRKDGKPGGLSEKTIRHHHGLLSSMLQDAVEWGLIRENICSRIKAPKVTKKEKTALEIEQAQQLLTTLNLEEIKYKVIVLIAIFTGFRRGEIMGLSWDKVNFVENTLTVEKTRLYTVEKGIYEDTTKTPKSKRTTFLPDIVMGIIREYKLEWNSNKVKAKDKWHDTNDLFVQWNGLPMHPDTISQWFPEFIRRHKLPEITLHGLRHTHASILLLMGMDFASVADQLGHANIQMLIEDYAHNVRKRSKDVAEHMSNALLKPKLKIPPKLAE